MLNKSATIQDRSINWIFDWWVPNLRPYDWEIIIFSNFINNPQVDKYSVIWCLYNPGKIPQWVFCFYQGKQKTPCAIHILLWFKSWITSGVFTFPGESKKLLMVYHRELFVIPELHWNLNAQIQKNVYNQVINEISKNASSKNLENRNWFSQPLVHTVITVWTRG